MSAYIVDKKHIQYLIAAMQSRRICQSYGFSYWNGTDRVQVGAGNLEACAKVGTILWQENVKSVNARYREQTDLALYTITERDVIYSDWQEIQPVEVIKACHCLEYQSCEHSGWQQSEAKAIIDTLIKASCTALVGYSKAAWGAPETTAEKSARIAAEMRPKLAAVFAN